MRKLANFISNGPGYITKVEHRKCLVMLGIFFILTQAALYFLPLQEAAPKTWADFVSQFTLLGIIGGTVGVGALAGIYATMFVERQKAAIQQRIDDEWGPSHEELVAGILHYDGNEDKPKWITASTLAPEGMTILDADKMLHSLFFGVAGAYNSKRGWNLPVLIQAAYEKYTVTEEDYGNYHRGHRI